MTRGRITVSVAAAVSLMAIVAGPAAALTLEFVAASGQLYAEPHDLVLSPDGRHLYVADNNNDRIAVLDPVTLDLVGTFGEDEVGSPHDVVFDAAGRLLVADTANDRIAIYEVEGPSGTLVGSIEGGIYSPEGVEVHPSGRVYATGAGSDNIVGFDDGKPVLEAGDLSSPHDVIAAADGSLWIADAGNDRLVHMTAELEVVRVVEGPPYGFSGPRYLKLDDSGRLWVADKYTHSIKVLDADLALILTLGTGESGLGVDVFDRPEGVDIRGTDIWFSDTYNDRIVRYRIVE